MIETRRLIISEAGYSDIPAVIELESHEDNRDYLWIGTEEEHRSEYKQILAGCLSRQYIRYQTIRKPGNEQRRSPQAKLQIRKRLPKSDNLFHVKRRVFFKRRKLICYALRR